MRRVDPIGRYTIDILFETNSGLLNTYESCLLVRETPTSESMVNNKISVQYTLMMFLRNFISKSDPNDVCDIIISIIIVADK